MAIASNFPAIRPSLNLDFANAKALDPRITFSRASAATYYDGKTVAKAEENLLVRSQEFDHAAWSASSAVPTITANAAAAPDGTSTAHRIVFPAADSRWRQGLALTSGTAYTISIYARSNTGGDQTFRLWGQDAAFNSADLTATTSWQRFTYTFTASSSATFAMGIRTSVANAAADLLIWGMQVEARSTVTAYTPTTTQPITNYIQVLQTAPAGVPRFDHNPVTGESLGLLIEEQRTNLLTYSEQLDNAVWAKNSAVILPNAAISPDGSLSADKLVLSVGASPAANDATGVLQVRTLVAGIYTYTVYAKAGELTTLRIREGMATGAYLDVNLLTGSVSNQAPSQFVNPLAFSVGNGWWRISWSSPDGMTAGSKYQLRTASTGDGYSGIYIWGAQLEAGSFPTSYIKTEAGQVTRAADSASMTGANFSSWYRQGEGTLMAEARNIVGATVFSTAVLTDDQAIQTTNRLALFNRPDGVSGACALIAYSNSEQISNSFLFKEINKTSIAYKNNDVTAALNGVVSSQDTTANIPAFTRLRIGQLSAGSDFFTTQTVKRISYYPKRLSDAQLQALTA